MLIVSVKTHIKCQLVTNTPFLRKCLVFSAYALQNYHHVMACNYDLLVFFFFFRKFECHGIQKELRADLVEK